MLLQGVLVDQSVDYGSHLPQRACGLRFGLVDACGMSMVTLFLGWGATKLISWHFESPLVPFEDTFGFGQVVALFLLLLPLVAIPKSYTSSTSILRCLRSYEILTTWQPMDKIRRIHQ